MAVRLEPVYLANILLHVGSIDTVKAFPFVSKNCRTALRTLRTNPQVTCDDPSSTLALFPHINTLIVKGLSCLEKVDSLPDTVTGIVVVCLNFTNLTDAQLKFADRVVEIRGFSFDEKHPANLALFRNLQRFDFSLLPGKVILSNHTLKRLTIHECYEGVDRLPFLHASCAEQIIVVFIDREAFVKSKARRLPPNVHLFCSDLGEGVTPADFYTTSMGGIIIPFSDTFGADDLRAFNEVLPVPFKSIEMDFRSSCYKCDVSFLRYVTKLHVSGLKGCTLTIPTSVLDLEMDSDTKRVGVSGTENLTSLRVENDTVGTTPCPRLQELMWYGKTLVEKELPCPISHSTTLSDLNVHVSYIQRKFRFPTQLTSLGLWVRDDSVDRALLTPLTRLQKLDISADQDADPLDLSGLTTLTGLDADGQSVSRLPTSLVEYRVSLKSETDISYLTNLTSLTVSLESDIRLTFPTGLKRLCVDHGSLGDSNISDVALESFESGWNSRLTWNDLEKLPRTLKAINSNFESASLKHRLPEMFPLLQPQFLNL